MAKPRGGVEAPRRGRRCARAGRADAVLPRRCGRRRARARPERAHGRRMGGAGRAQLEGRRPRATPRRLATCRAPRLLRDVLRGVPAAEAAESGLEQFGSVLVRRPDLTAGAWPASCLATRRHLDRRGSATNQAARGARAISDRTHSARAFASTGARREGSARRPNQGPAPGHAFGGPPVGTVERRLHNRTSGPRLKGNDRRTTAARGAAVGGQERRTPPSRAPKARKAERRILKGSSDGHRRFGGRGGLCSAI